jgi:hypothetical protein
MVERVRVTTMSVHYIIHRDLKHYKKSKTKVHHLTAAATAQRKKKASIFYSSIKVEQYKIFLSMDGAILSLDYQNGQTDFFHQLNDPKERKEVEPMKSRSSGFAKQQMFAAGFCSRRRTRLYLLPEKAKVYSALLSSTHSPQ